MYQKNKEVIRYFLIVREGGGKFENEIIWKWVNGLMKNWRSSNILRDSRFLIIRFQGNCIIFHSLTSLILYSLILHSHILYPNFLILPFCILIFFILTSLFFHSSFPYSAFETLSFAQKHLIDAPFLFTCHLTQGGTCTKTLHAWAFFVHRPGIFAYRCSMMVHRCSIRVHRCC